MSVVSPAYNSTATEMSATSGGKTATTADSSAQVASATTDAAATVMSEGDTPLPEKVAYVPETRPQAAFPDVAVPTGAAAIAGNTPQPLVQPAQTAEQTQAVAQQVAAGDAAAIASKAQATTQAMSNGVYVTAGEPAQPQVAAPKKSLFASLFSTTPASAAPAPLINSRSSDQPAAQAKTATAAPAPAKPIVELASATPAAKPVQLASLDDPSYHITGADALPGVRQTALFEIKRKSGIDDESDVDLNEDEGGSGSYQVASAAGMARLAPNGLLKQNESVDVACLKPSLVRVLKTIEGHFGRKMVVTSGYRDPSRNRRANGAKNSL
ncbi:D-Ala-D-Ala carboxypeptidase family metallohydrolase, partial [Mesorhizobium sp. M2A.F.Ca.ET.017.03.2.1]